MFGHNHQAQQVKPGDGDKENDSPVLHEPYIEQFKKMPSPKILVRIDSKTEQKHVEPLNEDHGSEK
jgi:hypothetical protein